MTTEQQEALELLDHMTILLARGWCQGLLARLADGAACGVLDPDAASWCLLGALNRVTRSDASGMLVYAWLRRALIEEQPDCGSPTRLELTLWNDAPGRTQAEVLALVARTHQIAAVAS